MFHIKSFINVLYNILFWYQGFYSFLVLKRPKTGDMICKECFYQVFEDEIHETIVSNKLFKRGERVAIAASGGKGIY